MAAYDILPSTSLSDTDIRDTIREKNLGTCTFDSRSWFLPDAKINKWSKYKPVKLATYPLPGTDWWKATDGYCGFSIPQFSDIDSLIADTSTWTYNLPTGGANDPLRSFDFRGYKAGAVIPFSLLLPDAIRVGSSGTVVKLMMLSVDANNLSLNDIVGNKYFGVVVKRGTQIAVKTSSSYISAGDNILSIDDCGLLNSAGTITIAGFLTSQAIPTWTSVADQPIWSLNAESNYAYKNTTLYVPEPNTYTLGAGGFAVADRTALVYNNDLSHAGDRVSRTAVSARALANVYELISVTGRATRDSDNVIVKEVNITIDAQTSPQWLEVEFSGMNVTFNTANGGVEDGLPALSPDDHYNFSWTFTFQQI